MKRLKLRKQQTKIDCGPACLTMLAGYYGYNTSISEFSDLVNLNTNGCSMYDMQKACEKISMTCDAYEATISEIIEARDKKEITFPLIFHIVSEEKMLHFVVVDRIDKKKVHVFDPGQGECNIPIDKFENMFTGKFMEIKPDKQFSIRKKTSHTLEIVKACIKENKKTIIPIYVLAFVALGLELLGTVIYPIIVEYVQNMKWTVVSLTVKGYELDISLVDVALILILCYGLKTLVEYIKGKLTINFSCSIESILTKRYYKHTLNIGLDKFKRISTGDMIARGNETDSITSIFSEALVTIIVDSIVAILVFVMLFRISVKLLICLLITVLAYVIILCHYKGKIKAANEDVMRSNSKQISGYKEVLDSIKQVKTRKNEGVFFVKLSNLVDEKINQKACGTGIILKQNQLFNFISLISGILILVFGASEIRNERLSLGTLLMFNAMTGLFINPLLNILGIQTTFRVTEAAIDRLDSIFYYEPISKRDGEKEILGDIVVSNMSYGYNKENPLFENVSVCFEKGKSYGIVGKSGTGKSTFADILVGLYEPDNGDVQVDGVSVRELPSKVFNTEIALVSQESYFYSETIKDNLLEELEVDEQLFYEICEACKVNEFVLKLPMAYETIMNEGGMGFSSGQKQRLAIAKALLTKPKILILDEATSNLDEETESKIIDYMLSLNITLICIAHRNKVIEKCEKVYKLTNGSLIFERG